MGLSSIEPEGVCISRTDEKCMFLPKKAELTRLFKLQQSSCKSVSHLQQDLRNETYIWRSSGSKVTGTRGQGMFHHKISSMTCDSCTQSCICKFRYCIFDFDFERAKKKTTKVLCRSCDWLTSTYLFEPSVATFIIRLASRVVDLVHWSRLYGIAMALMQQG